MVRVLLILSVAVILMAVAFSCGGSNGSSESGSSVRKGTLKITVGKS